MNRKDLASLAGIVAFSGIIALMLGSLIFSSVVKKDKAPVVEAINSSFPETTKDATYQKIFNSSAIDPTQQIKIGDQTNNDPFKNR